MKATRTASILDRLGSPYDREILHLAVPALGTLAAEPLYVLVDTAIVGHLGRSQLAALGIASTALTVLVMFNFLQYSTTAQVARALGAGERVTASRLGAQSLWLSLAVGLGLAALMLAFAPVAVAAIGGEDAAAGYAVTYIRIVALGLPAVFLTLGGQGFLRGISDLRSPLLVVIAGNVVNVALEMLFVYGFGWGVSGSAAGTAIAQTGMGLAIAALVLRRVGPGNARVSVALARRLLSVGKFIFVRTAALISAFLLAGAVVARSGDAMLGAYQITFQLFLFLALVLDAIAIAGQIIIGRELGASRADDAYAAGRRMMTLSALVGAGFSIALLALAPLIPHLFTGDRAVIHECLLVWPIFALVQPLAGVVFALDGILIGASDGPYLAASMVAAFAACVVALAVTLANDLGARGAWGAIVVLMIVRFVTLGVRFRRRHWAVPGWAG